MKPESQAPALQSAFTVDEIKDAFKANPVNAKDYIDGRDIEVTGRVVNLSNNAFGGDRAAVVIDSDVPEMFSQGLTFWFEPYMRPAIGRLSKGQLVTLQGRFSDEATFTDALIFQGRAIKTDP